MGKEAMFYVVEENGAVRCFLCAHNCKILPGRVGICGVRKNIDGVLYSLVYNKPVALNIDPIEKKPLYHFLPGTLSYSLATIGCNFKCDFCQNWQISQIPSDSLLSWRSLHVSIEEIIAEAKSNNCQSISYTYTEPTIFFEYAYDIACKAKEVGLYNIFVTNGYMSSQALITINEYLDAANIDLKSFSEDFYQKICKAHLKPVLDTIQLMKKMDIWIEITTLLIPGLNDSDDELKSIADFIANLDVNIPWHISRFHPDYKLLDRDSPSLEQLMRAKDIGEKMGLKYIYLGNVWEGNDTYCYKCHKLLVKREYFSVKENNILDGHCKFCGEIIRGVFY